MIVELKRGKTPRQITAQALDYASWVEGLAHEAISRQANGYLSKARTTLEEAFAARFGLPLPEVPNENHSIVIVGSEIDPSSERIIRYLSNRHGVNINAVTFSFFSDNSGGAQYVARVFLVEPEEVQQRVQRGSDSKRQPKRTPEELVKMAEHAGVGALYRELVDALCGHLQRGTTRSSIAFSGRFGDSTKVVISLIPEESSESTGLRFHAYLYRLGIFLNLDISAIEASLPESREEWKYSANADKDWWGAAGYFRTSGEVARFLALFAGHTGQDGGPTPA